MFFFSISGCFCKSLQYLLFVFVTYAIWAAARWRWQDYKLTVRSPKPSSRSTLVVPKEKNTPVRSAQDTAALAYQQKWVGFPELSSTNCTAAFTKAGKNFLFAQQVSRVAANQYLSDSSDCLNLRRKYGFDRYPKVDSEELNFPIGFILLFNSDFDQVRAESLRFSFKIFFFSLLIISETF